MKRINAYKPTFITDIYEKYAGRLVQNLSYYDAVDLVCNLLTPKELSQLLDIQSTNVSNLRAGRRSLNIEEQDVLYNWYRQVSGAGMINANYVPSDRQARFVVDDVNAVIKDFRQLRRQMDELVREAESDFSKNVLSRLYSTRNDVADISFDTNDTIVNNAMNAQSDFSNDNSVSTRGEHYNDTILLDSDSNQLTLIRNLPMDYDFNGNEPYVNTIRPLTYVDITGYREVYDEKTNEVTRVKIFNNDEYTESGEHLDMYDLRFVRLRRQQQAKNNEANVNTDD